MFFSKSGLVILKVDQGNFEKAQIFPVLLKGGKIIETLRTKKKEMGKSRKFVIVNYFAGYLWYLGNHRKPIER